MLVKLRCVVENLPRLTNEGLIHSLSHIDSDCNEGPGGVKVGAAFFLSNLSKTLKKTKSERKVSPFLAFFLLAETPWSGAACC